MFGRRNVTVLKHHRNATIYRDGRYLVVEGKMSMRSKRGRQLALEVAQAIYNEATDEGAPTLTDELEDDGDVSALDGMEADGLPHPDGRD